MFDEHEIAALRLRQLGTFWSSALYYSVNHLTHSKSIAKIKLSVLTWHYAGDDDGHRAGKAFKDIVGILYYNCHDETSECVQGHKVPDEKVVAKEESFLFNLEVKKAPLSGGQLF